MVMDGNGGRVNAYAELLEDKKLTLRIPVELGDRVTVILRNHLGPIEDTLTAVEWDTLWGESRAAWKVDTVRPS